MRKKRQNGVKIIWFVQKLLCFSASGDEKLLLWCLQEQRKCYIMKFLLCVCQIDLITLWICLCGYLMKAMESIPHFSNFVPPSPSLHVFLEVLPTLWHLNLAAHTGCTHWVCAAAVWVTVSELSARCRPLGFLSLDRSDQTSCLRLLRRKWGCRFLSLPTWNLSSLNCSRSGWSQRSRKMRPLSYGLV